MITPMKGSFGPQRGHDLQVEASDQGIIKFYFLPLKVFFDNMKNT